MLVLQTRFASSALTASPVGPVTPSAKAFAGAVSLRLNSCPWAALTTQTRLSFGLTIPTLAAVVSPGPKLIRIGGPPVTPGVAPTGVPAVRKTGGVPAIASVAVGVADTEGLFKFVMVTAATAEDCPPPEAVALFVSSTRLM